MKQKLDSLLHNLFGILAFIAILIGAVVAFMFIFGFLIGGSTANYLAMTGKTFLDYAIKIATIAVLSGLIKFYVIGKHSLTITNEESE